MRNTTQFLGFDPLTFLELTNIKIEDKEYLSRQIWNQLSEYLVIRIIELLPSDQLENIETPKELFSIAEKTIPNFKDKIKTCLEDWRNQFKRKLL